MSEFDMDAAVNEIGSSLFPAEEKSGPVSDVIVEPDPIEAEPAKEPAKVEATKDPKAVADPAADPAKPVVEVPVTRPAPASFAKDKAEIWAKMPPEAQEYYIQREQQMLNGLEQYKEHNAFGKQMKEAFTPYKAMMNAQGIDEPKAVQYLLNAHYRLTTGSPEQRHAAYQQLGVSMGLVAPTDQKEVDPAIREANERIARLEGSLTQEAERKFTETRTRVGAEVDAFSKDPTHPYFDEVSEDIVNLIHAAHARGETPDLKSIYDKAVWANPVTRQKELARTQQESEKALREKSEQEAEAARKASSANVRSRDTRRAPTEPLGTMEDTMRDTLKTIRGRAH